MAKILNPQLKFVWNNVKLKFCFKDLFEANRNAMKCKELSPLILTLLLKVPIHQTKRTFSCHFNFGFKAKPLQRFFLKVTIQPKRKGLSTVILVLLTKWSSNFLFGNLFESRNSMKVKRTFNDIILTSCRSVHLDVLVLKVAIQPRWKELYIVILALVSQKKLSWSSDVFFESHNSIKTKRTLCCHFSFT